MYFYIELVAALNIDKKLQVKNNESRGNFISSYNSKLKYLKSSTNLIMLRSNRKKTSPSEFSNHIFFKSTA